MLLGRFLHHPRPIVRQCPNVLRHHLLSSTSPLPRALFRAQVQNARHASTQELPSASYPKSHRFRQIIYISLFSVFFTSAGFLISTIPAAGSVLALMTAPSSEDSLRMYRTPEEVAKEIEDHMQNHPISQELREKAGWKVLRPHLKYPENQKKHSLTAGALLGPGRFPVPPLIFCSDKELVSLVYVGTDMCGHVGVVHGGLVATMLDEGLAWCGFGSLPNRIGMTAYLNVNYRKPVPAGSYLILRAETIKSERRKVWVKGTIGLLEDHKKPGEGLVEAEALYIEPKWAKFMPTVLQDSMR